MVWPKSSRHKCRRAQVFGNLQVFHPLEDHRDIPSHRIFHGDGIVHVSATDLLTENTRSVRVVSSRGLSPEDIQRIIYEAEVSVEADRARRERIQAGIQADSTIAAAEMTMDELHNSDDEVLAQEVWRAVLKVKEALAGDRVDEITCRSRELRELLGVIHRKVQNGAKQRS